MIQDAVIVPEVPSFRLNDLVANEPYRENEFIFTFVVAFEIIVQ